MADETSHDALRTELEDLRSAFQELTERLQQANLALERANKNLRRSDDSKAELQRKLDECRKTFNDLESKYRERTDWAVKLRDEVKALKALCEELRNAKKG